MIQVITISREYGSGGGSIGRILAERLRWKLIDDPLVNELAHTANVNPELAAHYDESVDPWFHRLFRAICSGGFEGVATSGVKVPFDADSMANLWHRAIREAAEIGNCVIIGRGGQCLLQDRQDTFHVSVYAPLHLKREILRNRVPPGENIEDAIRQVDGRRAAYIRRYFEEDWTERHLYHIMLCAEIGFETAADTILCASGLK